MVIVTKSKPLEASAKELDQVADQMQGVATALSAASTTLDVNAKTLYATIAESGQLARNLVTDIQKTVRVISSNDLPSAVVNLKEISTSLRALSYELHRAEGIGAIFLAMALLLSLWCLLNSLTSIGLASAACRPTTFGGRQEGL